MELLNYITEGKNPLTFKIEIVFMKYTYYV